MVIGHFERPYRQLSQPQITPTGLDALSRNVDQIDDQCI